MTDDSQLKAVKVRILAFRMKVISIKKLDPPGLAILLRTGVMLLLFPLTNDAQLKINCRIHLLTMMKMIHLDPLHIR